MELYSLVKKEAKDNKTLVSMLKKKLTHTHARTDILLQYIGTHGFRQVGGGECM